jgi:DNA-binding MarR family transcriptional regulator
MAKPDPHATRMAAWEQFLRAHAAITERLNQELVGERELPLTWYDVLIQLQERGGRMRMHELARSILFSKSGLTRLVDRMAQAGVVRREACSEDGRGAYAAITAAGLRVLAKARPAHHRGIEQHFGGMLTDAEAAAIESGLRKVAGALEVQLAEAT